MRWHGLECCLVSALLLVSQRGQAADAEEKSRFSDIGHPPAETADELPEKPPVNAGFNVSHTGRVTWMGLRADLPLSPRWSLVPQASLLHVAPFNSDESADVNAYFGGGVAVRPTPTVEAEIGVLYGPVQSGIGSVGGLATISKSIGGDPEHDRPPVLELEASVGATRYHWADGNGPAGADVTQMLFDLRLDLHATRRLTLAPQLMIFAYDKALDSNAEAIVGSVGVLARVGSYAPNVFYGAQVRYRVIAALEPYVEIARIHYAVGIGKGTEIVGGVRFHLADRAMFSMGMGVLINQVSGSLIDPDDDTFTLPVLRGGIELAF